MFDWLKDWIGGDLKSFLDGASVTAILAGVATILKIRAQQAKVKGMFSADKEEKVFKIIEAMHKMAQDSQKHAQDCHEDRQIEAEARRKSESEMYKRCEELIKKGDDLHETNIRQAALLQTYTRESHLQTQVIDRLEGILKTKGIVY